MLVAFVSLLLAASASAHTIITYPGWRGDNLHTNGTEANLSIPPHSLGINWDQNKQEYTFPYGMQWMYPCGGMPTSHEKNRTKWPIDGGAVAVQPGWFTGHQTAFFYINMGLGTEPLNMSHPVVPVFQIVGPSNNAYPGTFCIPQVPLPANISVKVGDHATIQVVETAIHGAALYNCVDIVFAEPEDVKKVTPENCFNSTGIRSHIGFNQVIATSSLNAASSMFSAPTGVLSLLPLIAFLTVLGLWP